MKILIFGGFGFIGKNLCEYLKKYYEIVIVNRSVDLKFLEKNTELRYYKYDFKNQEELDKILFNENPDFIINLISVVTASRDLKLFPEMINSNLNILLMIYEASKSLKNLKLTIQFGSGEEYGNIIPPFSETDREEPNSPYAIAKLLTTHTSLMLYKNYNYPICVVRPANLFGKYQDKTKFIPYIVDRLQRNEEILTTFGEQKRDFISAKEFVKKMRQLLLKYENLKGEIINIGSGESLELKEIILKLKKKYNSKSNIKFGAIPYRENETMDFCLDIRKVEEMLK